MKMEKITTKNQLAEFVADKHNGNHANFVAIQKLYMEVEALHGRSAQARKAVVEAERLRKLVRPYANEAAKKTTKKVKKDTGPKAPCLCGCGDIPAGRKSVFLQWHDARLKGMAQRVAQGDKDVKLTPEAKAFVINWDKLDADTRNLIIANG